MLSNIYDMNYPAPKTIRKTTENALQLTWGDGRVCDIPLQFLRKECPCAHCKGETILGKVYLPVALPTYVEGMNEVENIVPVGNYAVQVSWKDGHTTGIYTWEYLHVLCAEVLKKGKNGAAIENRDE